MADSGRPLTAKEKRQEQIKRWENSATDVEAPTLQNFKPRVKFHDGAVFLAACSSGDLKEVQSLLNKGADINFANVDGLTALHQACIDENIEVVEFLVEHGAEIDQEDNEGWTPLHAAASCGFMDIAKYLVKKAASVAAVNSEGEVPLDIAEDDDMITFLQEEVDKQGIDIETARNGERERMTIDAKQQLNAVSRGDSPTVYRHPKSGASALHVAAAKGYINVIRILLQAGMDVNLRDNDGWTPLHAASHWSQEEAAKLLADKNAGFDLRSKLGQTPFDVADEDMLEYLEELQEEQEKNRVKAKESNLIEPPNIKNETVKFSYSEEFSRKETKFTEKKPVENSRLVSSEKDISRLQNEVQIEEEENSFSSDEGDNESTSSGEETSTKPVSKDTEPKLDDSIIPYRFPQNLARTGSANNIDSSSTVLETSTRLKHSSSGTNMASSFSGRRTTRPASLHIATESKDSRPTIMSAFEYSNNRPVAAAQPMQQASKATNGPAVNPPTPTERNYGIKENSPDTWRSGLRKTGSFDNKTRSTQKGFLSGNYTRQQDTDKTSLSKSSEETSNSVDNSRTARVAPILDARYGGRSKVPEEGDSAGGYSFQKSGSHQRHGTTRSASTTTPATYKRSTNETSPSKQEEPSPKETSATFAVGDARPDRRRSYLQPVRDEEAEAQRKARSRRERQSRRSTQGVTLDVVEEAKKSIENKKRERTENAASASSKRSEETTDTETNIPHIDSNILLHRRLQGTAIPTSGSSGARPVTLPSAYIPSSERVGSTAKTAPLNSNAPPTINVQSSGNGDSDKQAQDDVNNAEDDANNLSVTNQRKSTAQQRRRQRKERRSTGLPELRPSEVGADASERSQKHRKMKTLDLNERVNSSQNSDAEQGKGDLNWLRDLKKVTLGTQNYSSKASGDFNVKKTENVKFSTAERNMKRLLKVEAHPNEIKRRSFTGLSPIPFLFTDGCESPCLTISKSGHYVGIKDSICTPLHSTVTPRERGKFNEFQNGLKNETDCVSDITEHSSQDLVAAFCRKNIQVQSSLCTIISPAATLHSDTEWVKNYPSVYGSTIKCFPVKTQVLSCFNSVQNVKVSTEELLSLKSSSQSTLPTDSDASWNSSGTTFSSTSIEGARSVDSDFNLKRGSTMQSHDRDKNSINAVKRKLDFTYFTQVQSDEDEMRIDDTDSSKAERLRATASRYESSSLSDRPSKRSGLGSDSDLSRYSSDKSDNKDYKKLFDDEASDNKRLQKELSDARTQIAELKAKLSQAQESSIQQSALESEKRRRRAAEQRVTQMERELMNAQGEKNLIALNEELKQQNLALTRLITKLGVSPAKAKVDGLLAEINNNNPGVLEEGTSLEGDGTSQDDKSQTNFTRKTGHSSSFSSETTRKPKTSVYKTSSLNVPSRHLSCSSTDSYDRRGSASSRSSVDSGDHWSTPRTPSSYVDAFANPRRTTSTSKFTPTSSASDISSGYHTIPPPASRTHAYPRTSTSTAPESSGRSRYSSSRLYSSTTEPKTYTSSSSYRSRGIDSPSRTRVPGSFSSASSKRVNDVVDSYRSTMRP